MATKHLTPEIRQEIVRRLDPIDARFAKEGLPAKSRSRRALEEVASEMKEAFPTGVPFDVVIPVVFGFFKNCYGENATVQMWKFSVPYMYRGEVFFYCIPFMENESHSKWEKTDFTWLVEMPHGLQAEIRASEDESAALRRDMKAHFGTRRVRGKAADFAGASAYHAAVDNLREGRLNEAAWSSLQVAEKGMKVVLKALGVTDQECRKLSHKLKSILDRLKKDLPDAVTLEASVALCDEPNVDFRYSEEPQFTTEQVYKKVRAAFAIWAFCNDTFFIKLRASA